jgi:hypothetical protein
MNLDVVSSIPNPRRRDMMAFEASTEHFKFIRPHHASSFRRVTEFGEISLAEQ